MKSGWESRKLGELAEIELGKTPSRASKELWDEKRETQNVWLSIADLLNAVDNVVIDSKEYVSDEGATLCKLVPKGTLLVSFKLTLGRLAFAGRDLFTNEAIAAVTPLGEREVSKEFLFWFFQFFDWVKAAENDVKLKGMTLNKSKLKDIVVHFPTSLAEQQRIVSVLNKAFAGLAIGEANTEKNLQNARALFESHLQSAFTQCGEGWRETTLGDVCIRVSVGHVGPTSAFYCSTDEGVPFIRSQNVRPGFLDVDGIQHITRAFHRKLKKSQLIAGDLLFVRVGANRGDCCYVPNDLGEVNCANIVFARPTEGNAAYLARYCQSPIGRSRLLGMSVDSAQGVINTSSVARLTVPLPPRREQQRLVEVFDFLQNEIERLEALYQQKLAALAALKKSLLHQAFTEAL